MNHWITAPVLIPAATAILLLLTARADRNMHRAGSVLAALATLGVAIALSLSASDGVRQVYSFGNWDIPLGIVFVVDRLSSLMVLLTSVVGVGALLYAIQGWDRKGPNFHALFQFQLMGINGAFLTGDIFNLFVFFEILLIASYGLLLHGGGGGRIRAGIHYVAFNLAGSALFLFGLGMLYGTVGTLNMADIAARVAEVDPVNVPVLRASGLLLMIVFSIKAAALPLYYWLPNTYASASAPVAALFAIMTKVGIYALLRLSLLVFGVEGGPLHHLITPWLVPVGLLTMFTAALGALCAKGLRSLVAWLVVVSVGMLLTAIGIPTREALGAGLYYMLHSTVIVAALFLLVDLIAGQRGETGDRLDNTYPVAQPGLLGGLFFVAALAIAGMPPLSGFFGKVLVLGAAVEHPMAFWIYGVVLGAGLMGLVGISRAGSNVFWKTTDDAVPERRPLVTFGQILPILLFLQVLVALVLLGGPVHAWMLNVAEQVLDTQGYIDTVRSWAPAGEG